MTHAQHAKQSGHSKTVQTAWADNKNNAVATFAVVVVVVAAAADDGGDNDDESGRSFRGRIQGLELFMEGFVLTIPEGPCEQEVPIPRR